MPKQASVAVYKVHQERKELAALATADSPSKSNVEMWKRSKRLQLWKRRIVSSHHEIVMCSWATLDQESVCICRETQQQTQSPDSLVLPLVHKQGREREREGEGGRERESNSQFTEMQDMTGGHMLCCAACPFWGFISEG